MFLFKAHKSLSHKECSVVGFVLALMSILTTTILIYGFPLFGAWLNVNGVYHLDLLLMGVITVMFFSIQGLLLFGFPLYYARDKKSHMTGFQILLYALMWMAIMVVLASLFAVAMQDGGASSYSLDDFAVPLEGVESTE